MKENNALLRDLLHLSLPTPWNCKRAAEVWEVLIYPSGHPLSYTSSWIDDRILEICATPESFAERMTGYGLGPDEVVPVFDWLASG